MPAKRTSNAAKGRTNAKGRSTSSRKGATTAHLVGTVQGDIIGVAVAVFAVALLATLMFPSSAVITSALRDFLSLSFGAAAPLVPIAIFAFAMTFFLDGEEAISGRVALGLSLIVLAILAMLSLNLSEAIPDPGLVFDSALAERSGGYVGGVVAYVLLELVGPVVGNVVLVGVIVAGVVICGFSVSDAVTKARKRIQEVAEERESRVRERRERAIIDACSDDEPRPFLTRGERARPPISATARPPFSSVTRLGAERTCSTPTKPPRRSSLPQQHPLEAQLRHLRKRPRRRPSPRFRAFSRQRRPASPRRAPSVPPRRASSNGSRPDYPARRCRRQLPASPAQHPAGEP